MHTLPVFVVKNVREYEREGHTRRSHLFAAEPAHIDGMSAGEVAMDERVAGTHSTVPKKVEDNTIVHDL